MPKKQSKSANIEEENEMPEMREIETSEADAMSNIGSMRTVDKLSQCTRESYYSKI